MSDKTKMKQMYEEIDYLRAKVSVLEKILPIPTDEETVKNLILAMELAEAKAELEQAKRERDTALSEICSRCERDYLQEKGTMFCSECEWNRRKMMTEFPESSIAG